MKEYHHVFFYICTGAAGTAPPPQERDHLPRLKAGEHHVGQVGALYIFTSTVADSDRAFNFLSRLINPQYCY
jgi:hypothetical protein